MPMTQTTEVARQVLSTLEAAFATRDVGLVDEILAEDVLFLGGAATALGRAEAIAYVKGALEHVERMEWDLGQSWSVQEGDGCQVAVAIGAMHLRSGGSTPYRLTVVLTETDDGWKICHFHGSTIPE